MKSVAALLILLGFASFAFGQNVYQETSTYSDADCSTTMIGTTIEVVPSDDCSAAVIGCTAFPNGYYKIQCWGLVTSPFPDPVPDNWIVFQNWPADQTSQTCPGQASFNYYAPPNSCTKSSGLPYILTSECGPDSPVSIAFYKTADCSGSPSGSDSINTTNACTTLSSGLVDAYGYCKLPTPVAAPVAPPMDEPVAEPMSTPIASGTPVAPIAAPQSTPVATPVKKSSDAASSLISAGVVIVLSCLGVFAAL